MKDDSLSMEAGDTMPAFTDGITEARKKSAESDERKMSYDMFGQERLIRIFQELGGSSPEEIKNGILAALEDYKCGEDDITFMALRRAE